MEKKEEKADPQVEDMNSNLMAKDNLLHSVELEENSSCDPNANTEKEECDNAKEKSEPEEHVQAIKTEDHEDASSFIEFGGTSIVGENVDTALMPLDELLPAYSTTDHNNAASTSRLLCPEQYQGLSGDQHQEALKKDEENGVKQEEVINISYSSDEENISLENLDSGVPTHRRSCSDISADISTRAFDHLFDPIANPWQAAIVRIAPFLLEIPYDGSGEPPPRQRRRSSSSNSAESHAESGPSNGGGDNDDDDDFPDIGDFDDFEYDGQYQPEAEYEEEPEEAHDGGGDPLARIYQSDDDEDDEQQASVLEAITAKMAQMRISASTEDEDEGEQRVEIEVSPPEPFLYDSIEDEEDKKLGNIIETSYVEKRKYEESGITPVKSYDPVSNDEKEAELSSMEILDTSNAVVEKRKYEESGITPVKSIDHLSNDEKEAELSSMEILDTSNAIVEKKQNCAAKKPTDELTKASVYESVDENNAREKEFDELYNTYLETLESYSAIRSSNHQLLNEIQQLVMKTDAIRREMSFDQAQLSGEIHQAAGDVEDVETAFSELMKRYNKIKTTMELKKENLKKMEKEMSSLKTLIDCQQEKLAELEKMGDEQLNCAQEEVTKIKTIQQGEKTILNIKLRKSELKSDSLEKNLSSLCVEQEQLQEMCSELSETQ